ncbi:MAG: hypothetical protein ACREQA_10875 [Candidatus Binatia bacterium]
MDITLSRIFAIPSLIATLALAGCSTMSPIVSEWSHPGYTSSSFKRIMVGGADGQNSIRRSFEDEFVAQLRAAGVDALPSYRYIPEVQSIDEAKLKQAAQKAGADAAILARLVSVEQKTEYGPSYYPSTGFGIFGRNFGASWSGPYGAPSVHRYDLYTSEATLYDVTKNEVVWIGTVQTTQPQNVNTAIKGYVESVIKALSEKNLLGAKK